MGEWASKLLFTQGYQTTQETKEEIKLNRSK
jgi:hypothetical protein